VGVSRVDTSTPVLLMCGNAAVGPIGALRTLGRMGVQLYALAPEHHGRVWSSRYCRRCFDWDPLNSRVEQSLERLCWVGRQFERRALLLPTFDEGAIFAATHCAQLREYFVYPTQSAGLVRSLVSKKEMYVVARRHGIPVPETVWPESRNDVLRFAKTAQFPVTLKAIRGVHLKKRAGVTAFIVPSAGELLELYDRYEDFAQPNLMVQEYIPGDDNCGWGFNGYFNDDSDCILGGTTRRLRQYPVHVGNTSLAVIQHSEEIDGAARRFMKAVGYRGLVNIGFRYDARDGQYKVVDVNPRLGASFRSFITKNGSDVLRAFYLDLTGQPVLTAQPRVGRKWLLEHDLRTWLRYHSEGHSFRSLLALYRGVRELAYFSVDDPCPALAMCLNVLFRPLHRWRRSRTCRPADASAERAVFGL